MLCCATLKHIRSCFTCLLTDCGMAEAETSHAGMTEPLTLLPSWLRPSAHTTQNDGDHVVTPQIRHHADPYLSQGIVTPELQRKDHMAIIPRLSVVRLASHHPQRAAVQLQDDPARHRPPPNSNSRTFGDHVSRRSHAHHAPVSHPPTSRGYATAVNDYDDRRSYAHRVLTSHLPTSRDYATVTDDHIDRCFHAHRTPVSHPPTSRSYAKPMNDYDNRHAYKHRMPTSLPSTSRGYVMSMGDQDSRRTYAHRALTPHLSTSKGYATPIGDRTSRHSHAHHVPISYTPSNHSGKCDH